ncbi:hypothetical protein DH2020_037217 [Rehmannia glutinosa]|uniref:AB hydrolase-1 domain-containing protein n=1 Tax=Rehmannia glutinosa TaxID=99300 RepID=A0ABR0V4P8_REHGL
MEQDKKQNHFVLIHGACHGAWCWYKVVTWLRSEGHRVTALDMAAAGANPKRVEELSSISDYYQPLMEFMVALPSDERVVLVGHSMEESAYLPPWKNAVGEDLTLATLLVRPVGLFDNLLEEGALSKENYGSVRRVYVICDGDKILKQDFQEWLIEKNPTDEVKVISGADHMVMFSKSQELCACLQQLANKYC